MAKTESTAVNELIDLMQNGKQQPAPEPSADLFSAPKSTRVNPPRMTSPVPAMRGAGEVEPLPRGRAPHSTSQLATESAVPPVRMSTADPSRGNTIPPISRPTTRPSSPPNRATSSNPAVRATSSNATVRPSAPRTSAPPVPHRASSPSSLQGRPTVPSVPSLPPLTAPVAAPFESRREDNPFGALPVVPQQFPILNRPQTVDVTGDIVKADNWFDVSAAVHKIDIDGTAVVPRPTNRDTLALVKKLIVPTILLAIVGIMIGGFFAFDGDGGKRTKKNVAAAAAPEAPPAEAHVAMAAAANGEAPAAPNAEAPAAEAPAAPTEAAPAEPPTKAEEVAKQAAAAAEAPSGSMLPAATTAALTKQAPAAAPAAPAPSASATTEVAKTAPPAAPAPAAVAKAAPSPAPVAAPAVAKTAPAPAPVAAPAVAKTAPAPAPVAAPAVAKTAPAPTKTELAPAPVKAVGASSTPGPIREVQTPRGVVKLVDVRINSKPSGATVMLVDDGKTSFLGSTPLATSLDPSRKYDVIFTAPGRPTQMAPLDPSKTSRLDVTLSRGKSSRAKKESAPLGDSFIDKTVASKAETPVAAKTEAPKVESKPAVAKTEAPKAEPKKVEAAAPAAKAEKKVAAPAGEGTLMVSSKPPCEILIDGKATGLTTPQRSIPLSAGTHKITFVNEAEGIKKTVSVSITADQSTKLIQDLMKK